MRGRSNLTGLQRRFHAVLRAQWDRTRSAEAEGVHAELVRGGRRTAAREASGTVLIVAQHVYIKLLHPVQFVEHVVSAPYAIPEHRTIEIVRANLDRRNQEQF